MNKDVATLLGAPNLQDVEEGCEGGLHEACSLGHVER